MGTLSISTLQMRVATLYTTGFFILCSLCISTNALSPGLFLGQKGKKGAKGKGKGAGKGTGSLTPADDTEEATGSGPSEASEPVEVGAEVGGAKVEAAGEEEVAAPLASTNAGKSAQVKGLITKLKDINGFLNNMVTYWDDLAGESGAGAAAEAAGNKAETESDDGPSDAEEEAAEGVTEKAEEEDDRAAEGRKMLPNFR